MVCCVGDPITRFTNKIVRKGNINFFSEVILSQEEANKISAAVTKKIGRRGALTVFEDVVPSSNSNGQRR